MGYTSWSNDFYADRERERVRTGASAFAYNDAIKNAPIEEQKCHPEMDPKGMTRESRDSDAHPESIAIAVMIDQTGSMASTPRVLQKALPDLMTTLIEGGCEHPQVLFGAIGDARDGRERAPIQVGQFESGIEMDDDLGKIFMEGRGGGSFEESYQNAIYFFARHASCDCIEKRSVKGKLFLIGDEMAYPYVYKSEIERLFGDTVQDDIPLEAIVEEAKANWDIYFVIPAATSHANDPRLHDFWVKLLGESNVIRLDDASQICGAITRTLTGSGPPATVTSEPLVARL